VPIANGAVQFEWYVSGCDLEIEFDPSGRAQFVLARADTDEITEGELGGENGYGGKLLGALTDGVDLSDRAG